MACALRRPKALRLQIVDKLGLQAATAVPLLAGKTHRAFRNSMLTSTAPARPSTPGRAGFTLIELMIVVAIVGSWPCSRTA
jgi:prepilin-type N-terminal cleavage/methylation domain-containing protein